MTGPGHSVEKIGGTSIAATETIFDNVLIGDRKGDALYHRIFIVSAYAGMTDLLLEHKKTGEGGVYGCFVDADSDASWQDALDRVEAAMRAKNAEMFDQARSRAIADSFVDERIGGVRDCLADVDRLRGRGYFRLSETLATLREMLAGVGEAHSAHNTALLLRDRGVAGVMVDLSDWPDHAPPPLDERIALGLAGIDYRRQLPIVTGYARSAGGMVKQFARGYSEMTFSRVAGVSGAREAIIHKEFHLSSADPKLVGEANARKIGRTNYAVADQLANLGMEAIHPGAGRGLRQAGIPLRVKNAFDPKDEGTLICDDYVSNIPRVEIVTGVGNLIALEFFEQDMVGEKGYDAAILDALTRHRMWIVSKSSNANTITHYLKASTKPMRQLIEELEAKFPNAAIAARKVAMVALIGSDLSAPGLVSGAMTALDGVGIPVLGLQHQIRNVDIQFIVERGDFARAIRALHHALVEERQPVSRVKAA